MAKSAISSSRVADARRLAAVGAALLFVASASAQDSSPPASSAEATASDPSSKPTAFETPSPQAPGEQFASGYLGINGGPRERETTQAVSDVLYYLEAMLNGASTGEPIEARRRGDSWRASSADLERIGVRVDDLQKDVEGMVALDAIPGLSFFFDAQLQRLELTSLAGRLVTNTVRREEDSRAADMSAGVLFNYDAVTSRELGHVTTRAVTEQRIFGQFGVLSQRGLSDLGGGDGYTRLDTTWTHATPDMLRTLALGDVVSRSLAWSRSTRIGGLQIRRNFALRPDLVTYPVPVLLGEAAVPSTVELYVNSVRQMSTEVPGGPFRLEGAPMLTGAGQAQIVVRDALGRETVQSLLLYVTPQLLAAGLTDYSFEVGRLRERFGLRDSAYASGEVMSASLRHGAQDWLTLEAHAERAGGFGLVGTGVLAKIGRFGQINASFSASDSNPTGTQRTFGYQYSSNEFGVGVDIVRADDDYRDLASLIGDPPSLREERLIANWRLMRNASLSMSYVRSDAPPEQPFDSDADGDVEIDVPRHTRLMTLSWTQQIAGRASLSVSSFRDLDQANESGVFVGISMSLRNGLDLQSSYTRNRDSSRTGVTASRQGPYSGGWDWRAGGDAGDGGYLQADARYRGRRGTATLTYDRVDDESRVMAGGSGAVAFVDGAFIPGRYVQNEFVIVSTGDYGHVPVIHENRFAGRTGDNGYLLVNDVNAYQVNRVAIDPLAVPYGYRLTAPEREATPSLWAGALVRFPIDVERAATVHVVDADGEPIEVGSRGVFVNTGEKFIVGYDGVVFIGGLGDSNKLQIELAEGTCEADFSFDAQSTPQPDLGTVHCR